MVAVEERKHLFFCGAAGTGKSALVAEIVRGLCARWPDEPGAVCVTALTGLAAIKAGGQTIHSWAGIGIQHKNARDHLDAACEAILRHPGQARARRNWARARVLIIDEVSMLTCDLLDLLDKIGRRVRLEIEKEEDSCNDPNRMRRHLGSPFGGIQLIMCGDFMQLPPIADSAGENEGDERPGTRGKSVVLSRRTHRWAFYAECWAELFHGKSGYACRLTEVFRQRNPRKQHTMTAFGLHAGEPAADITSLSRVSGAP